LGAARIENATPGDRDEYGERYVLALEVDQLMVLHHNPVRFS